MSVFQLELLGGPWSRRLAARHAGLDVDWAGIGREAESSLVASARGTWTRSAFSEYASGASFAAIASALLEAKGVRYQCRQQKGSGIWQIFVHDPNGARVELDFSPEEPGPK